MNMRRPRPFSAPSCRPIRASGDLKDGVFVSGPVAFQTTAVGMVRSLLVQPSLLSVWADLDPASFSDFTPSLTIDLDGAV